MSGGRGDGGEKKVRARKMNRTLYRLYIASICLYIQCMIENGTRKMSLPIIGYRHPGPHGAVTAPT